ncbi:MAG: ATP-binding cassette domain-containing protein [Gammaproteobacteria bacterium]|nr:ATP-binding cassette domain-containing protein [Gammaproteobacteria bacterium]
MTHTQEQVLELKNVRKNYGKFTAVKDISLTIPKGSIYGFLGPNGAGKTTTIRMILDIIKPSAGTISIMGGSSALDVRHEIGYLPEEKGLYKKMAVNAVITYFAMLKGMTKKAAQTRTDELLEKYDLNDFADALVETLSKGMAQKVQVLSTIAHNPSLVILDEPFSGLDPINQQVLETLIRDMADNGQTVIFSTHIMEHAERLCDRILLIAKGQKIFDGTVAEAKSLIPRRILLETRGSIDSLQSLENITEVSKVPVEPGLDPSYLVHIPKDTHPQDILKHCFDHNIALSRFEYAEPSLHDVFVHLVGDSAWEQRL